MLRVDGKLKELDSVLDDIEPHSSLDVLTIPQIDFAILNGEVTDKDIVEFYDSELKNGK